MQVSEQELVQALEAAVTCCILAAAGPQRSRVLANLYKDERTRTLPVFPFLEKVYLERILRREEVCVCCVHHMCKTVLCVFWDEMFVSCGVFRCSELLVVVAHSLHDHTTHDINCLPQHLHVTPGLSTMLQTMTLHAHWLCSMAR